MADSMETGVSCGQLVCAAVLPCSILMDERADPDDVQSDGETGIHVGVSQMMQVGNALKQARVQYRWWIQCYSWQYIGENHLVTVDSIKREFKDGDYKKKPTHIASQKGMLRCVDASQPLSSPTTTKSVIMLTCGSKVQIDPAFLAEYETEREKFFSENTQDKHQKRMEHLILVGEDEKTHGKEKSTIQGEIKLDGRKTTLPSETREWDYEDGKPDSPCVTSNEANHMVKLGDTESAKPCIAHWQCTAMLACPFNMCLAPYWLHAMANYMDKQTHTVNKTAIAFEKREQTVVHMHSDDIPGLMQDVMNHLTGGATGRYQVAGGRGVFTDPGLL